MNQPRPSPCHLNYPIKLALGLLVLSWSLNALTAQADALDDTVAPKPKANYTQASFRFVNPDPSSTPDYILVFIPGTNWDGRGIVAEPKFLSIAKACHAALIGCNFTGIELGYDQPSGGTGEALDEAISHFATQSGQPRLAKAPLLLIGLSQGGNFTYNYLCWRPERVKAFAATKWMIPSDPKPASYQVPGIIATGEKDEPGRIAYIAKTYKGSTGQHAKWAFLYEAGAGHDLGDALFAYIHDYFEATCHPHPGDQPVTLNLETGNPEALDSAATGVCWFPNQKVADEWKTLHKPDTLQDLMSKWPPNP